MGSVAAWLLALASLRRESQDPESTPVKIAIEAGGPKWRGAFARGNNTTNQLAPPTVLTHLACLWLVSPTT